MPTKELRRARATRSGKGAANAHTMGGRRVGSDGRSAERLSDPKKEEAGAGAEAPALGSSVAPVTGACLATGTCEEKPRARLAGYQWSTEALRHRNHVRGGRHSGFDTDAGELSGGYLVTATARRWPLV